ncbi:MAG: tRNA pseudouridine(38-40) synthase TruA [Gemmatimonadota bacterium]|nr:tRNA pseudouridine(38-40) synthase TruA [Gemmatimonadota bacterium]
MSERTVQLVLHYDGAAFSGWQRQPSSRTVQGVLEDALARLHGAPVAALGAGRTDAGVHARGQAVGVRVSPKWEPSELRRAVNAVLPDDVWVAAAFEMAPAFHARYSAVARRYTYRIGTDDASRSPFRRRWEWALGKPLSRTALEDAAEAIRGTHIFRAFAVRGTAPEHDDHRCTITRAAWRERTGGVELEIEANRFLHHMVRFLVGTMVDIASGRRDAGTMSALLNSADNDETSAPAPAHGLCLESVRYPEELYLTPVNHACESFSTPQISTTSTGPSAQG